MNLTKSDFLITSATVEEANTMASVMSCGAGQFPVTYLGLPLSNKRLNKMHYMPLIERISKKLTTWKASMLSIGGRITLLNATLTAMPIYMMQTFLLPKWVINRIDKVRRAFLWHGHKAQQGGKRYMSLASWELVTTTREQGGLGIKNLHTFNKALLAKVVWKWMQAERPPWMQMVRQSTPNNLRPWEVTNATKLWQDIKKVVNFMENLVNFHIGKGMEIRFWTDQWMGMQIKYDHVELFSYAADTKITVQQAYQDGEWVIVTQGGTVRKSTAGKGRIATEADADQYGSAGRHNSVEMDYKWCFLC